MYSCDFEGEYLDGSFYEDFAREAFLAKLLPVDDPYAVRLRLSIPFFLCD